MIYEVSVRLDPAILSTYEQWLFSHIEAMLAFPGFVEAHVFRHVRSFPATSFPQTNAWVELCVHYVLEDELALRRYLAEFAEGMRKDARAQFAERFMATRRILRDSPCA